MMRKKWLANSRTVAVARTRIGKEKAGPSRDFFLLSQRLIKAASVSWRLAKATVRRTVVRRQISVVVISLITTL